MKLTNRQKNYLIDLGLQKVLDDLIIPVKKVVKKVVKKKGGWSKAQHAKFAKTMADKFGKKRGE